MTVSQLTSQCLNKAAATTATSSGVTKMIPLSSSTLSFLKSFKFSNSHIRIANNTSSNSESDSDDATQITELVNTAFLKDKWFKTDEYVLRLNPNGSSAKKMLEDSWEKSVILVYSDKQQQQVGVDSDAKNSDNNNHEDNLNNNNDKVQVPNDQQNLVSKTQSNEDQVSNNDISKNQKPNSNTNEVLLGCIKLEFNVQPPLNLSPDFTYASFGMLAVPERNGGRGIGSQLLRAVEELVKAKSQSESESQSVKSESKSDSESQSTLKVTVTTARLLMPLINVRPDLFPFYSKKGYKSLVEGDPVQELPEDLKSMVNQEYKGKVGFIWWYKDL